MLEKRGEKDFTLEKVDKPKWYEEMHDKIGVEEVPMLK